MASNCGIKRSLSRCDSASTEEIHRYIKAQQVFLQGSLPVFNPDVSKSSMIFPEQYDASALNLCVDVPLLKELEGEGIINWCLSSRFLMPLEVEEDGNSLLHSLSLYLFGVHDRMNVLRQLLYQRLFMEEEKGQLRTRWKTAVLEDPAESSVLWEQMVEMASDRLLDDDFNMQRYATLTGIHVFTLANIIARPIIVLSNSSPRSKDSYCGGIYLPLLQQTNMCEKSPVILGYKNNHFAPLISSENLKIPLCKSTPSEEAPHCVPLMNSKILHLPLQYLSQSERTASTIVELHRKYLEVVNIPCDINGNDSYIDAAMITFKAPPSYSIKLMWSLKTFAETLPPCENNLPHSNEEPSNEEPIYEELIPCKRQEFGCNKFASFNSEQLCQSCCEHKTKQIAIPKRSSLTNITVELLNTNVSKTTVKEPYKGNKNDFYAHNKHVKNELNDTGSSHEKLSGQRSKLLCNVAGCTQTLLVGETHCGVHSKPQAQVCTMKHCTNTAEGNDSGLCIICFQSHRAQVKKIENKNLPLKGHQQLHHVSSPQFQCGSTIHTNVGDNTSPHSTLEPSLVNDTLPSIPMPASRPSHQEQVNPQLCSQEGFKRTLLTPSNLNHPYDSQNPLPSNVQDLPQTGNNQLYNENLYTLPVDDGSMRSNLNHAHYQGQVKQMEIGNAPFKGQQCHSVPNPHFYSEPMQRTNMGDKTHTHNGSQLQPITAGLPPIPKPPSGSNYQERVNPQLCYPEGHNGASSLPPNSNHLYSSHQFSPSNVQDFPLTRDDEAVDENPYISLAPKGDRGSNQNLPYYGDQYGLVNKQNKRMVNIGLDQNNCLFCGKLSYQNHGGYCNECNLRRQREGNTKCLNCERVGFEKFNLLCETCYKKQYEMLRSVQLKQPLMHHRFDPPKGGEITAILNHNNSTNSKSLYPTEQQGCKRVGCEFFGSIEFGGYCSGCFMDLTKQQALKDRPSSLIPTDGTPAANYGEYASQQGTFCRSSGCPMYGSAQWNGFCFRCSQNLPNK